MTDGEQHGGFWRTLPGILSAVAAFVTAITGLIIGLGAVGVFSSGSQKTATGATQAPTIERRPERAASTNASPGDDASDLRPWSTSEAKITSRAGEVTVVDAPTLTVGGGGIYTVQLSSGQSIPFEQMRSLDIPRVLPDAGTQISRAQSTIKLVSGKTLKVTLVAFTALYASNSVGQFRLDGTDVMRVDFLR